MQYETVVQARFLKRVNRFVATVELAGREETVHVKNTGRCLELLVPGAQVILARGRGTARKTAWDLVAVRKLQAPREGRGAPQETKEKAEALLINMDATAPNDAAAEWLPESGLFSADAVLRREVTWGKSRFDFEITEGEARHFVEVKGVTLEEENRGFFPDAPTERGVKHIEELIRAKAEGFGAILLFVAQWERATSVSPNEKTHPAFAQALRNAAVAGVRLLAVRCRVFENGMEIIDRIPVDLTGEM